MAGMGAMRRIYAPHYRRTPPAERRRIMRARMLYRALRRAKGMEIPEWLGGRYSWPS